MRVRGRVVCAGVDVHAAGGENGDCAPSCRRRRIPESNNGARVVPGVSYGIGTALREMPENGAGVGDATTARTCGGARRFLRGAVCGPEVVWS
jgi:hypothetical protein